MERNSFGAERRPVSDPVHSQTDRVELVRRSISSGTHIRHATLVECPFCEKDIAVWAQSEFITHTDR
jgi:hypothetical protein